MMLSVALTKLELSRPQIDTILTQLQANYPAEGCGFLSGSCSPSGVGRVKELYPITNVLFSATAFLMEPGAMVQALLDMEQKGETLLAIYHSHPHGAAALSATDIAETTYPEAAHLIVSLLDWSRPQWRAYRVRNRQGYEIPLEIL